MLHGIDLRIDEGEFSALIGPSGSGKSTLLNLMGLFDTPSAGDLRVCGEAAERLGDAGHTRLRNYWCSGAGRAQRCASAHRS